MLRRRCATGRRAACVACLALAGLLLPGRAAGQSGPPQRTQEQQQQLKERDRLAAASAKLAGEGKNAEAADALEKALAIERAVLGPLHDRTAGTLHRLAVLYANGGDYPENKGDAARSHPLRLAAWTGYDQAGRGGSSRRVNEDGHRYRQN